MRPAAKRIGICCLLIAAWPLATVELTPASETTTDDQQQLMLNARLLDRDIAGQRVERHVGLMGTDVSFLLLADDSAAANASIDAAIAEMARLEAMMTDWTETSQLSLVNREAAARPVPVDPELFEVFNDALRVGALTDGAFDISYASAGRFWDFKAEPPRLPDPTRIAAAVAAIDYQQIVLDTDEQSVHYGREGLRVGLGGIAKGAIVDHAARLLAERGHQRFVINAGGDIYAHGHNGEDRLWWVAIRHPRQPAENLAVLPVANLAVVTSGDYERFIEVDGTRYCHIIDPRSGWPARGCQSVTVLAPNTGVADALATGIFVLGPEAGLALAERLPQVEALIVDAEGTSHLTSRLQR